MTTRLIQIIRVDKDYYYEREQQIVPSTKWIEVEAEELIQLEKSVQQANALDKKKRWNYFILYYMGREYFDEIFATAQEFIAAQDAKEKKARERAEAYERGKAEKADIRKRKQLEKLKKELGEV